MIRNTGILLLLTLAFSSCVSNTYNETKKMQEQLLNKFKKINETDNLLDKESIDDKYDKYTIVTIKSNVDSENIGELTSVILSVNTTERESLYTVGYGYKEIDYVSELEKGFTNEFSLYSIELLIYENTGLELDQKSIPEMAKEKNIQHYLEINHKSSNLYSTINIENKYDVILYDLFKGIKIWRAQVSIKRQGFGFAGLNEKSTKNFAKKIIETLIEDGFDLVVDK